MVRRVSAGRPEGGQFASGDSSRSSAGQVDAFETFDQRKEREATRQWFTDVHAERERFFSERRAYLEQHGRLPDNPEPEPYVPGPKHPEIEGRHEWEAARALSAWTGRSVGEVKARARRLARTEGIDATTAYRRLWQTAPRRTDKPFVYLDLEAAAPELGEVDRGPYSEVIEVGWVKEHPDGTVERHESLYGVHPDLLATDGTGAQHIHNISPEMVADRPRFVDDLDAQRELMAQLRGCVVVAHAAKYEDGQLGHNLRNWNFYRNRGDVEVLDTRAVSSYFMPDNPTNTNKAFVEATGGTYEGAHRALADAEMTRAALGRLKP